jgi:predicted nucleotidyltransferase
MGEARQRFYSMTTLVDSPTPYRDVNELLRQLLSSVQAILKHRFAGMYLYGSLALGDFALDKSDIDFVVVTDDDLSDESFLALKEMHARIATGESKWARELEGSYIPRRALRRYDPQDARHPHIDRGDAPSLTIEPHESDWVIQRYVLRAHGVALAGPPIQTLIDPVSPSGLRQAIWELLHGWWAPMPACRAALENSVFGYRCYAVLTMCRMLYTLAHGTVVSKPMAARWAQETIERRWTPLIRDALAWSPAAAPNLEETLAFIRYTCERSEDHEATPDGG